MTTQILQRVQIPPPTLKSLERKLLAMLRPDFDSRNASLAPLMEDGGVRVLHIALVYDTFADEVKMRTLQDFSISWLQLQETGYPTNALEHAMGAQTLYLVTDGATERLFGLHLSSQKATWQEMCGTVHAILEAHRCGKREAPMP